MLKKTHGFTIVELLIVIVVIAILAAISTVAYNGIQTRAENSKTIAAVTQYVKAVQLHKTDTGEYPLISANAFLYNCLGEVGESCGMVSGTFTAGECEGVGGLTNASNNAYLVTLNDAIKARVGKIPEVSQQVMQCANRTVKGAFYFTFGSNAKYVVIRYYLKGNQECQALGGSSVTKTYIGTETTSCAIMLNP